MILLQEWVQAALTSTYQVDMHGCENLYLEYDHEEYFLSEIRFHSPSEHSVGGGYYAAEVQLVHETVAHDVLVLAVLLEVSPINSLHPYNNTFLDQLWTAGGSNVLTGAETTAHGHLDPYGDFLPGDPTHYRYSGSLTRPPCTEGVEWFVFADPVKISYTDYNMLKGGVSALSTFVGNEHGSNNRFPTQDLHDRHVELYTDNTDEAEARLASSSSSGNAEVETAESISIGAIVLASVSLLITVCSMMVVCSLKAQLDCMSSKVTPV
jgi:carbonic anhydrase